MAAIVEYAGTTWTVGNRRLWPTLWPRSAADSWVVSPLGRLLPSGYSREPSLDKKGEPAGTRQRIAELGPLHRAKDKGETGGSWSLRRTGTRTGRWIFADGFGVKSWAAPRSREETPCS